MKKLQKAILTVLVVIFAGITVTITLPDVPEKYSDETETTMQTCPGGGPAAPEPVGPFGDDETDLH